MLFSPNLFDIYGKPSGTIKEYAYSKDRAEAEIIWTEIALIEFGINPQQYLVGTKARFPGVKCALKRGDQISYLNPFHEGGRRSNKY